MKIFAFHTDDGVPMNETALCSDHAGSSDAMDHVYGMLDSAEDAPEVLDYLEVSEPQNNDTVCVVCGVGGAEKA